MAKKKMERMERLTTSIKIDPDLWKTLRLHVIAEGKETLSEFLERVIRKGLEEAA